MYGFSIINIVKHNPKEKTIHFGGIKGQAIRQRYIDMTYDTLDKDGNVKTLALFTDIDVRMQRYTFSHPKGLLFATQFAQIALAITEKAAFDDMRPPDTTRLDLCGALTRSKTFDEAALREVVEIVGRCTNALLEIVNVCVSPLVTLRQLTLASPGIAIRRGW